MLLRIEHFVNIVKYLTSKFYLLRCGLSTRRGGQFMDYTPTRHTDQRDRGHSRSDCFCRFAVAPAVVASFTIRQIQTNKQSPAAMAPSIN